MGLIVFGVSYKVFLKAILKDKEYAASKIRMLAASPTVSEEASAGVFVYSLTLVLLSLELMCLTHSGFNHAIEHLFLQIEGEDGPKKAPHWPVILISAFKVCILGFSLTLSQWTTDPAVLTVCGCGIVLALAVTRVLNFFFINSKDLIESFTTQVTETLGGTVNAVRRVAGESIGIAAQMQSVNDETEDNTLLTKSNHSIDSASDETGSKDLDAIVIADLNGIIIQVNDTTVTLFGKSVWSSRISLIVSLANVLHSLHCSQDMPVRKK